MTRTSQEQNGILAPTLLQQQKFVNLQDSNRNLNQCTQLECIIVLTFTADQITTFTTFMEYAWTDFQYTARIYITATWHLQNI